MIDEHTFNYFGDFMSIGITGGREWKKIIKELERQGLGVMIGVLEDSTTPDGASVAEYAFYNEFGTKNIPARPFMKETITDKKSAWAKGLATLLKGVITSKDSTAHVRKALGKFGIVAKQDIQNKISENNFTPNSVSWLLRKGTHKPPLIDTGDMLKSIDYEVVKVNLRFR